MTDAMEMQNRAPAADAGDENGRLMKLVGELIATNQELRFKLAQVEQQAARGARDLAEAAVVYRLLMP
jgi:hypothetical protein